MKIEYDKWQQEILDYQGDILLCKGRRIGGTEIFAIKAAERMISQPGVKIVFISLTEDQAKLIISVAHEHLVRNYKSQIATGAKKPTLRQITLKNGSTTKVRPVGNTGNAVRGFDGEHMSQTFIRNYEAESWRGYGPGPPKIFRMIRAGEAWGVILTR